MMLSKMLLAAVLALFTGTVCANSLMFGKDRQGNNVPIRVGQDGSISTGGEAILIQGATATSTTGTAHASGGGSVKFTAWATAGTYDATVTIYGTDVYCGTTCASSSLGATSVDTLTSDGDTDTDGTYLYYFATVTTYVSGTIRVSMNRASSSAGSTVAISQTTTDNDVDANTELPAAAALADNTANPTVPGVGAYLMGFETTWDRLTSTSGSLNVNITGGSSSGTEYTEGATDASITGTAMLWEDAADTLATISAASPLPVDLPSAQDTDLSDIATQTLDISGWDGTAGTPDAQVLSVQGITSMTPILTTPSGPVAHDASATSSNPQLIGGYASAAAPSDVSGDGDSVRAWHLRNGAQATVLTAAGALIGGDATNGLDVDVTRQAGSTPTQNLDVDESEDAIKASAGRLTLLTCFNLAASKRYVKLYDDTVANVAVGTTTPVLTLPLPASDQGFVLPIPQGGLTFANAITIAATTGFAVADTGAPSANDVICSYGYQ